MTKSTEHRFRIVFAKLAEATEKQVPHTQTRPASEASSSEIDEIDQLRRLVLEISEPEQTSYMTT